MKIRSEFECATDGIFVGWYDSDREQWVSLEDEDAEEEMKRLLKRKDAPEIILNSLKDFASSLREALNTDLKELYERSEKQ